MRPRTLGLLSSLRFLLDPLARAPAIHSRHGGAGGCVRLAKAAGGMTLVFEPEAINTLLSQPDVFEHLDRNTVPVRPPPDSAGSRLMSGLLALTNGPKHRALRKELTPAFDHAHLRNYFILSRDNTRDHLSALGRGTLDLNQVCHELAMNNALVTLFGVAPGPETREMASAFRSWMHAGFSPWTILLPFNLPGFSYHRFLRHGEDVEARLTRLLRGASQTQDSLVRVVFGEALREKTLPPEMVSRAAGYLQASYETTANTLVWTLVLLNLFPDAAARARKEMTAAIGDGEVAYAHLANLPFTRSLVTEAMRLLPPVLLFPRVVTRATVLGEVEFSPGDRLLYGPALTHRLAHVYHKPLEFDPARFLDPALKPSGFLAFGGGPRRCPGEQFAVNEILVILALWLKIGFPRIQDGTSIRCRGLVAFTPRDPIPFRNMEGSELPAGPARLDGMAVRGIRRG